MNIIIRVYRGFLTLFSIFLIAVGALYISYFIFPFQNNLSDKYKTLYSSWKLYIKIISKLGIIKVNSNDLEKLRNIKNSIIVSTHPSLLDIVILMSLIPNATCFVAEKLGRNPFFKKIVQTLFIVEGRPLEEWVDDACKRLDDGLSVIIFPMGHRHSKNEFPRIHRGAALLAYKSHKDIISLSLEQSYGFLQIHKPAYDAGDETVIYDIKYLDKFNTEEYLKTNSDEISVKTYITKYIARKLYNQDK